MLTDRARNDLKVSKGRKTPTQQQHFFSFFFSLAWCQPAAACDCGTSQTFLSTFLPQDNSLNETLATYQLMQCLKDTSPILFIHSYLSQRKQEISLKDIRHRLNRRVSL